MERLAEFAVKNRLLTATTFQPYVRAGLLFCYVTDMARQFHRAGIYIDRVLKGAKPADLPILTIPPSLLQRADRVIE